MMKRILTTTLLALALAAGLTSTIFGQSYVLDNTTLNGAISASQTTLVLTSASASTGSTFTPAAGMCLFVDREMLRIQSISSTTATVSRGSSGGSPHASGATVWIGTCSFFKQADPALGGNQVCTAQPQPWLNVNNGNIWWCDLVAKSWSATNAILITYGSSRIAQ